MAAGVFSWLAAYQPENMSKRGNTGGAYVASFIYCAMAWPAWPSAAWLAWRYRGVAMAAAK